MSVLRERSIATTEKAQERRASAINLKLTIMRIPVRNREHGSALAVTLITCLLIGIVLAGYMGLVSSRYKITVRSQCWNAAIPVAEAGVEEALAHLHDDSNNPAANNWTMGIIAGQTVYSKQRTNTDGSYFLANLY